MLASLGDSAFEVKGKSMVARSGGRIGGPAEGQEEARSSEGSGKEDPWEEKAEDLDGPSLPSAQECGKKNQA